MIFTQMIIALGGAPFSLTVLLTLIFIALPLILGYFLLRKVIYLKGKLLTKDRMIFAAFGVAGVFYWSNYRSSSGSALWTFSNTASK